MLLTLPSRRGGTACRGARRRHRAARGERLAGLARLDPGAARHRGGGIEGLAADRHRHRSRRSRLAGLDPGVCRPLRPAAPPNEPAAPPSNAATRPKNLLGKIADMVGRGGVPAAGRAARLGATGRGDLGVLLVVKAAVFSGDHRGPPAPCLSELGSDSCCGEVVASMRVEAPPS
jgi:hypothetical protein